MDEFTPLVYVAGPITIPDPIWNTHTAVLVADRLYNSGLCVPLVPHMNLLWHFIVPHDVEYWYKYDLAVMKRCEAVLRLPGESKGAEAEVAQAVAWRLPVFYDVPTLLEWVINVRDCTEEDAIFSGTEQSPPAENTFADWIAADRTRVWG